MQGELAGAQEALKAARSESARRLRELQALQSGGGGAQAHGGAAAAAAVLAAETAAREAAEAKLREVKAAHARKKQLVTDLRKRVRCRDTTGDGYHHMSGSSTLVATRDSCRCKDQQCTKSMVILLAVPVCGVVHTSSKTLRRVQCRWTSCRSSL